MLAETDPYKDPSAQPVVLGRHKDRWDLLVALDRHKDQWDLLAVLGRHKDQLGLLVGSDHQGQEDNLVRAVQQAQYMALGAEPVPSRRSS